MSDRRLYRPGGGPGLVEQRSTEVIWGVVELCADIDGCRDEEGVDLELEEGVEIEVEVDVEVEVDLDDREGGSGNDREGGSGDDRDGGSSDG